MPFQSHEVADGQFAMTGASFHRGVYPGRHEPQFDTLLVQCWKPTTAHGFHAVPLSRVSTSDGFDRQDQAVQYAARPRVKTDPSRDALLTAFGKATLTDRYLMPGETFQDLFARVASYYGDDEAHAQRLYDYISKLWFMPATPVLSNGGTDRGLPISCFLNEANDSLGDIVNLWNENVFKVLLYHGANINRLFLYATKLHGNSKSPIFLRLAPLNTFRERVN